MLLASSRCRLVRGSRLLCWRRPAARSASSITLVSKEVETGFDVAWRTMSHEERLKLIEQYERVEKQDWHNLTLEQKRARTLRNPLH